MRIHWRDFVQTVAFKVVKSVLHVAGYDLIVMFNDRSEATDVYIVQLI